MVAVARQKTLSQLFESQSYFSIFVMLPHAYMPSIGVKKNLRGKVDPC
jgi:hypothetical protein